VAEAAALERWLSAPADGLGLICCCMVGRW
jgi:hypothetical protein